MKLAQLAQITGIPKPTLNARINSLFNKDTLERDKGNHIIISPEQAHTISKSNITKNKGVVIRVGNLKGGVGKTSLSYLLADATSSLGLKTCIVDLDIQMNLTSLYTDKNSKRPVFLDIISGKAHVSETLLKINDYLSLIPSSLRNSLIEKEILSQNGVHLLNWFNDVCLDYLKDSFDIIIFDTPPDLSTLNSVTGLCLDENDSFLFPIDPDTFSLDGVELVLYDINKIRTSYRVNKNPNTTVVMNRFEQSAKEDLKALIDANDRFGDALSETIIRKITKLKEYTKSKKTISNISRNKDILTLINGLLSDLKIIEPWGN